MFDCETCGKIKTALFDGYAFGDRILEGVIFKATYQDDGKIVVESVDNWDTDPYLSGLNKGKWIKAAQEYAEDLDIFECPNCKDDVCPEMI